MSITQGFVSKDEESRDQRKPRIRLRGKLIKSNEDDQELLINVSYRYLKCYSKLRMG
jgi:hypothetical protein